VSEPATRKRGGSAMIGTAWGEAEHPVDPNLSVRPLKPELTRDDFKMARARCIEKNRTLEVPRDISLAGNGVRWLIDAFDNCMKAEGFEMIRTQPRAQPSVASAVSSESWVAWSEVYTANDATNRVVWGPQTKPEQGFESLEKCEMWATGMTQGLAKVPSSTAPGHSYYSRYFCLPSGTDPRGPKGK